jgi:hypothetical protein
MMMKHAPQVAGFLSPSSHLSLGGESGSLKHPDQVDGGNNE